MKSPIVEFVNPNEIGKLKWEVSDKKLSFAIRWKIFKQIWLLCLMTIFVACFILLFDLIMLLPTFANDNSLSIRIIVVLFLLALNALLFWGLSVLIKDELLTKLILLFSKKIWVVQGECVKSYTREVNIRGRFTARFSDFSVGTQKIKRSFSEEVPIGTKYVFIRANNEIIYYPLGKLQKIHTEKTVSRQVDSSDNKKESLAKQQPDRNRSISKKNQNDVDLIQWRLADYRTYEKVMELMKNKFANCNYFFIFIIITSLLFIFQEAVYMIRAVRAELPLTPYLIGIAISLLLSVVVYRFIYRIKCENILYIKRSDKIWIADAECIEYYQQRSRRSNYYYAEFLIGDVRKKLPLSYKEYHRIKKGLTYLFILPKNPSGDWIIFPYHLFQVPDQMIE